MKTSLAQEKASENFAPFIRCFFLLKIFSKNSLHILHKVYNKDVLRDKEQKKMKTLTIYEREVSERRQKGFFATRYEFIVKSGDEFIYGSEKELNNPRLRIGFDEIYSSRSEKKLIALIASIKTKKGTWKMDNRSVALRTALNKIIKE